MRKLTRYFDNPFDAPSISLAELMAFSTDHLGRLRAHNKDGSWDERIAATVGALEEARAGFTQDQSQLGRRKGAKSRKEAFRAALPAAVARIYSGVLVAFGAEAPQLAQCFPRGRKIFSDCRDDQLTILLEALRRVVQSLEAELMAVLGAEMGAALVARATALKEEWQSVYAASESASGAKSATQAEKRRSRQALQLALYVNLAVLMQRYPGQPEKLRIYMQQHLLENPKRRVTPPSETAPHQ